jgi:Flp pilus assembly protein TadG
MVKTNNRRGVALVLAALLCLVLVPIVGLAIDGSIAYMMRGKLSTAIDAAVLAGARSLNRGADIASQRENAKAVARRYFAANLPQRDWGATVNQQDPIVIENDTTHIRSVSMTASADVPLTFLSMLHFSSVHIGLSGTAQRRDVNVELVLDHSGSMKGSMGVMQAAATNFVDMFAGGRDNLGLVVFGGNSFVAYPPPGPAHHGPDSRFKSASPNVAALINSLQNGGYTGTSQAIWRAWGELQTLNEPGALNVIVLFTDGRANTLTADFQPVLSSGSKCKNKLTPKIGFLAAGPYGIVKPDAGSLNDNAEETAADNSDGCVWVKDLSQVAAGISSLPKRDYYGNSTNGAGTMPAYTVSSLSPVNGNSIVAAAQNALDDAANRIRSNATLKPVIYVIGLGGNGGVDDVLLRRVANDPSSIRDPKGHFDENQAAGLYVYSPTTAQLHAAFMRIASEILRLSI